MSFLLLSQCWYGLCFEHDFHSEYKCKYKYNMNYFSNYPIQLLRTVDKNMNVAFYVELLAMFEVLNVETNVRQPPGQAPMFLLLFLLQHLIHFTSLSAR